MKQDIVGNEVWVNDIVLVTHKDSNNLFRARVIKDTQKGMKCEIFDAPDNYQYMIGKVLQRLPKQVIKIGTFDLDGCEI